MGFRVHNTSGEGGVSLQSTAFGITTANGISCCGWMQLPVLPSQNNTPHAMVWLSTSTTEPDNFEFLGSHYFVSGPTEAGPAVGYRCGLTGGSGFPQVVQQAAGLNTWYFIAASFNAATNLSMGYIGVEGERYFRTIGSFTQPGTAQATENGLTIGQPFGAITAVTSAGACSNIRFWTRVLSQTEFIAEMHSEVPVSDNSLYAWYPLKNMNQNGAYKGTDFSGNGFHLTFSGSSPNIDWVDPTFSFVNGRGRRLRRTNIFSDTSGHLFLH